MFDYSHVTPETAKEYEAVLAGKAAECRAWIAVNRISKDEPLEDSYKFWWLFKGPTGFRSSDHALRFRTELLQYLQTHPEPPEDATSE